ncbi:MAG TPA: histidine kinase, partial [Blastocatellia bacterium]
TSFFALVVVLAIFGVLAARLLNDLIHTRRNRTNIAASLGISLVAFVWTAVKLAAMTLGAIHVTMPRFLASLADTSGSAVFLIFALGPIPLGLFLAYKFHKATFMDNILKKGASLLILIGLAVINAHIWADLVTLSSFTVINATLRPAIFVGIWLSLFVLYLPLRRRAHTLVDKYLLRRRDYSNVMGLLTDRVRSVTDEETLKDKVCEVFKEAFSAEFVRFLAPDSKLAGQITHELDEWGGSQVALTRDVIDEELYHELNSQRAEAVLAIKSSDKLYGLLIFGPRIYGQGYLSEELKLLSAVSGHIASLLENMHLHVVRRGQAVAEQELRKLATQAQLTALRAQIDPHFFFNALNSVAALISEDPEAAEELVEDLAEFFRAAFKPNREFTTVCHEIDLVDTYLKVEKTRFGDKLTFMKHIDPETLLIKIPALSIQPLVENAVKHGLSKTSLPGAIVLSVKETTEGLAVSVSDTGAGFAPGELSTLLSRGVGLSNVDSRLVGLYGEQAHLKVDAAPGRGATVSFTIPAGGISSRLPDTVLQL